MVLLKPFLYIQHFYIDKLTFTCRLSSLTKGRVVLTPLILLSPHVITKVDMNVIK